MRKLAAALIIAVLAPLAVPHAALADTSSTRRHLSKRAKSQLGTRYRYGGGSPRSGFDCSGYTRWVFKKVKRLPHSSIRQYKLGNRANHRRVHKRKRLKRGDLVFFKTTKAKVGHVGMYLRRGRFIHASSGAGKVTISSVWDKYYYGPRFRGGVRVRQLIGD